MKVREPIDNYDIHASLNYLIITTKDGVIHFYGFKEKKYIQENEMHMRIKRSFSYFSNLRFYNGPIRSILDCWRNLTEKGQKNLES